MLFLKSSILQIENKVINSGSMKNYHGTISEVCTTFILKHVPLTNHWPNVSDSVYLAEIKIM